MNNLHMNYLQKYLSTCLLGIAALVGGTSPAWAQVTLGAAANFAVLGNTVTCVGPGSVRGDVGANTTFTPGACTFVGGTPGGIAGGTSDTNPAASGAQAALTSAYNIIQGGACTTLTLANTGTNAARDLHTLSGVTLTPGTYCIDDVAKTGTLTLTGPSNGVWIFKVIQISDGALTGTDFTVVMNGGQPCNVFWAPVHAATMTRAAFLGTILAGNTVDGTITTTDGSLIGRALAHVTVSLTRPNVIGCGALAALAGATICKDRDEDDEDENDHDRDHDKDHHDRDHDKNHDGDHDRN